MADHKFGGDWTSAKLDRIRKYLCAYTTIFERNKRACHFRTIYVDAFAGTGHRSDSVPTHVGTELYESETDADTESYKKGSARIALEVRPPFHQYVFIERDAARVEELRQQVAASEPRPGSATVHQSDSNEFLNRWCRETDWETHRAVVFLDPYGMQVDWTTMEALARTKSIDVWVLFPVGMAVNRLLTGNGIPPPEWAGALTRFLGTDEWQSAFYQRQDEDTLFGKEPREVKVATWKSIGEYFVKRLTAVFERVATNPLPLCNSRGTPIYLLCFAAGNPKGATTAVKIASDVLKP
ncbi:MAG: three-Cys-motif partner protein TcmP [Phycisphaerales bacterium]|nr:three-Cys-motif partner protein TcmP [Phycisphaerales bacterium]